MPSLRLVALVGLVFTLACESGTATVVEVSVDDAVATDLTPDAPGILVTDGGETGWGAPLAALCGEPLAEPITYTVDFGFGCLRERSGPAEETVRAWVAPMPAGWDADAFCALTPSQYDGLAIGADVTGEAVDTDTGAPVDTADTADTGDTGVVQDPEARLVDLGLATEPDPAWPQAEVTAAWKRDFSPCGGILKAELAIE